MSSYGNVKNREQTVEGLKFQHVIVKAGNISNYGKAMATLSPLPGPSTCKLVVTKFKCSDVYFVRLCEFIISILRQSSVNSMAFSVQCYSWRVKLANVRGRNY